MWLVRIACLQPPSRAAQASRGAEHHWIADLIVSAGTQFSGGSVASRTGAAHVAVFYVPTALPSPSHTPLMVPWFGTPPWFNRLLEVRRPVHDGDARAHAQPRACAAGAPAGLDVPRRVRAAAQA